MKNIFQPYWILLSLSLPLLCILALFGASYQIVESLLSEENTWYWYTFWILNGTALLASAGFALYLMLRKRLVPISFVIGECLLVMLLMAWFLAHGDQIIPQNIPRWMLFEQDLVLYGLTFYMPSLLYTLLALVVHVTPQDRDHSFWINVMGAILIPLLWYLFFMVVVPLLHNLNSPDFAKHVIILGISICTFSFVFFLMRGVLILANRFPWLSQVQSWIWQVPLGLLAPALGLFLNNHFFEQVFGNFSHPLYYIIAALNGLVLILPNGQHTFWRGILFILRSLGYSYIIYFVLVMLPYAGLTIPAVIFFGTGFLMLAPLAIGLWQASVLYHDYRFLKASWGDWPLRILFILSFAAIPLTIVINLQLDRQDLHKALNYALSRDYTLNQSLDVHPDRIKRSLAFLRGHQEKGSLLFDQPANYQPYITPLYNWLVLDNLTLSGSKMQKLEKLYLGEVQSWPSRSRWRMAGSDKVVLDCMRGETVWDEEKAYYRSWVHLTMHNTDSSRRQEFFSEFELAPGAWISNYYLNIEGRKEYGILAERKSAQWVYQQIVRTRRDPGIIYYKPSGSLDLRVFPLAPQETRFTGLEIIHREPIHFELEGLSLELNDQSRTMDSSDQTITTQAGVLYVPPALNKDLKEVKRRPRYHMLLDYSSQALGNGDLYIEQIQKLLSDYTLAPEDIQVSLVNYEMKTLDLQGDWTQEILNFPKRGGLDLEFAIKSVIWDHYHHARDTYPMIFILSSQFEGYTLGNDIRQFTRLIPEKPPLFRMDHLGTLKAYEWSSPKKELEVNVSSWAAPSVLAYTKSQKPLVYLSPKEEGVILPLPDIASLENVTLDSISWKDALSLQGQVYQMTYYPETHGDKWLKIVQNSFRTKVLTPHTSYISLENEAQKQALLAKQAQILKANKNLDADNEDLFRLSEPGDFWLWGLGIGLALVIIVRRKNG